VVVAVVLVAAGVVALGLSGGDGGGSETAPQDLEIADLEPALLTSDDVGEGFAVDPDDGDDDELTLEAAGVGADCREALQQFETDGDDGSDGLQANYQRSTDGVSVEHGLSLIDSGEPSIDDVADALRRCDRFSFEDGGQHVEMRLSVDDVGGLGEEAVGVEMSLDVEALTGLQVTLEAYGLVVTRDGVASSIFVTGSLDLMTLRTGDVDEDFARELAAMADEKIQDVLDG
jgi:hypothetical protein